jgi:hypothetical protein
MIGMQRDPRFAIGMLTEWRGQQYELVGIEPRRRRDGRDTLILVWRASCLVCGASFATTTPQRKLKYPTRHCPMHTKKRLP